VATGLKGPGALFSFRYESLGMANPTYLSNFVETFESTLMKSMEGIMTIQKIEDVDYWDPESLRFRRQRVFRLIPKLKE
jgi:hypothetical protein